MTVYQGALIIFNGPDRTNINKVGAALGRGPESLTRKLTETDPPLWDSSVSGWYAFQAGGTSSFDMWNTLVGQTPTEDDYGNPIVWGDWGLTEQEATDALALLSVYAYSSTEPQEGFIAATAATLDPVQFVVPEPEV